MVSPLLLVVRNLFDRMRPAEPFGYCYGPFDFASVLCYIFIRHEQPFGKSSGRIHRGENRSARPLVALRLVLVHAGHFPSAYVSFWKQGRHHDSFFRLGRDKHHFVFDRRLISQAQGHSTLRSNGEKFARQLPLNSELELFGFTTRAISDRVFLLPAGP